jgi:Fic family protein
VVTETQLGRGGRYLVTKYGEESVRAYVPTPLPPDPPIVFLPLIRLWEEANQALGRLDALSALLPNVSLILYTYVRKEAVLSSQIEGTQSSISDLLLYETSEAPGVPTDDVEEVSNYVKAMNFGLRRLRGGFPISLRLFREMHAVLLSQGRGSDKDPGEFRRTQNWIGGTRPGNASFVPPPPEQVMECMGALEVFLQTERPDFPLLIKAGLAHVQFETIHPFLDGNGRIGRLIIPLLLCASGVLREPLLYLSLYFKQHRSTYYELLDRVRTNGDWESWLEFFLTGIRDTAGRAVSDAQRTIAMFDQDRQKIQGLGRPAASVLRVFEYAQRTPILSIPKAAEAIGISAPTVAKSIEYLRKLTIMREITGRQRRRLFVYDAYLAILNEGTEPIR